MGKKHIAVVGKFDQVGFKSVSVYFTDMGKEELQKELDGARNHNKKVIEKVIDIKEITFSPDETTLQEAFSALMQFDAAANAPVMEDLLSDFFLRGWLSGRMSKALEN